MRSGVDCKKKGQVVRIIRGEKVTIHFNWQIIFGFAHKGITLGAGEEVDEVAGWASGIGVDRIDEIGDRVGEGQATGVYGMMFKMFW